MGAPLWLAAACLLLAAACAPSEAPRVQPAADATPRGFDRTTWGMTPDQVVAAEAPRARSVAADPQTSLGDLARLVTMTGAELGSETLVADFYFDAAGTLQTVVVKPADQGDPQANSRTFSSLERFLTKTYGPATRKEGGDSPRVFWELPSTTIRLVYLSVFGGRISRVNASYAPPGLVR